MSTQQQNNDGDLKFERHYPLVYAALITIISTTACLYLGNNPQLDNTILEAGITVASIIIGFNAIYRNTLQTKISKTIQAIENTSYMELYHSYLRAVTHTGLYFILASFIILFLSYNQQHHYITFNIWLFFAIHMTLCFYRANNIDNRLFQSK